MRILYIRYIILIFNYGFTKYIFDLIARLTVIMNTMGNGFGSDGIGVTSNSRIVLFESGHCQIIFIINCICTLLKR